MASRRHWWLAFATAPFVASMLVWGVLFVESAVFAAINPGGVATRWDTEPDFDGFMWVFLTLWGAAWGYVPGAVLGIPLVWWLERGRRRALIDYALAGVAIAAILCCIMIGIVVMIWPNEPYTAKYMPDLLMLAAACMAYGVGGMITAWWAVFRVWKTRQRD